MTNTEKTATLRENWNPVETTCTVCGEKFQPGDALAATAMFGVGNLYPIVGGGYAQGYCPVNYGWAHQTCVGK